MTPQHINMPEPKPSPIGYIPKDWECMPFSELFDRISKPISVISDCKYQEIGIRSHGKGIFHKEPILGALLGEKRVFQCIPGKLAFNIVFAWEQAVALVTESEQNMIASHRFPMYSGKKDLADEQFYLWFFKSPRGKHALSLASPGGAGRNKTLGQGELDFMYLPVPPLAEQQKIAAILSTWDTVIEQMLAQICAKKCQKDVLRQQLLNGKIRFARHTGVWKKTRLPELCRIRFSSVDKKTVAGETLVRLCNYTDVYYNDIITVKQKFMSATATSNEIEQFSLYKDDILLTKDSESPEDIAKCAVVMEDLPGVLCGYHLALLRPLDDVNGLFLAQVLNSQDVRMAFTRYANGVTRFGLPITAFEQIEVCLPSLSEQRAIAAVLSTADDEIRALEDEVKALQRQKKGLMQKLLTGEVRVEILKKT